MISYNRSQPTVQQTPATRSQVSLVGISSQNDPLGSSLTVGLPVELTSRDQIVLAVVLPGGASMTPPSGYVEVGAWSTGSLPTDVKLVVLRRTADGSETSATVGFSGVHAKTVTAAVYRGVDPDDPIDDHDSATSTDAATVAVPSLTASGSGRHLVGVFAAITLAGGTWTEPTTMTEQLETSSGPALKVSTTVADESLSQAGSTDNRTATHSTSGDLVGAMFALNPIERDVDYDARGNRIESLGPNGPQTLTYDQNNRLSVVDGTTDDLTLSYNADGLRSTKTINGADQDFAWDVSHGLAKLLSDGTRAYVYGPDGRPIEHIIGSSVTYYHGDQLGSTRALTDTVGNVAATYTYDPFGGLRASTGTVGTALRFAGEYTDDETGFIYLRARHYDPRTGQFTSRDPLESITRAPYSYAAANPLNFVDPSGLCSVAGIRIGFMSNDDGGCKGAEAVRKYSDDVSDVAGYVGCGCAAAAVITSETVIGGAAFGTCAAAAETVSLGAGALHAAVTCSDLDETCRNSAASLAVGLATRGAERAVGPRHDLAYGTDAESLTSVVRWVGQLNVTTVGWIIDAMIDTTERQATIC